MGANSTTTTAARFARTKLVGGQVLCNSDKCEKEAVINVLEDVARAHGPQYVLVKQWALEGLTYDAWRRRGGVTGDRLVLRPALAEGDSATDATSANATAGTGAGRA